MSKWDNFTTGELNAYSRAAFRRVFLWSGWVVREGGRGTFEVAMGSNTWHIVIRSNRYWTYPFVPKESVQTYPHWAMGLAHYLAEQDEPDLFLIPHWAWPEGSYACLVGPDYVGKASKPEWGVKLSKRRYSLMDPFRWTDKTFPWMESTPP